MVRKKCIKVKGRDMCVGDYVIGKGDHVGYGGQITRIGKSTVTVMRVEEHPKRKSTRKFFRIRKTDFKQDFIR